MASWLGKAHPWDEHYREVNKGLILCNLQQALVKLLHSFISSHVDCVLHEHAVPIPVVKATLGCELGLIEQLKEGGLIE